MNYIMYYEMVIKNMELDYLHIITFASCVKKEIEVIQRVSKVLEIPTRGKTQLENLLNEYKNEMQLEETKKESYASSLPNIDRQEFKDDYLEKIKEAEQFEKAKSIYEMLTLHDFIGDM